ncbi:MAG: PAS-domain containing protein [Alphaproteobacteria bacterium]|nr:PAS-domain containing protein [Alphaproteobacteria bacterium]MBU1514681.1 PAS-domain containing protein [Alphaproteobacteria bacterium]MBU2093540.1 PAS-domain containing protein [Alphaproteobacteria bacterium]MBU2149454.1 PAS-domain containing protein [Alphaproteobacteria bacterium]MBU2362015.1 PAS-domain containing protein [Alphaproteobacteria bacterium]
MSAHELMLAAAAGAVSLAISAVLWAFAQRRAADRRVAGLTARIRQLETGAETAQASAEAFDSALLAVEDGQALLASGEESLGVCCEALGLTDVDPQYLLNALMRADPDHARRLRGLFERGEACAFEVKGPAGVVTVEGRAAGALAWLRVSAVLGEDQGLPTAPRFAALLNARIYPAWIAAADGSPVWVNAAWLKAVDAGSLDEAVQRGVAFDKGADAIASEAANLGQRREAVRWTSYGGRRRAFMIAAQPLEGGGVGVWTDDLTDLEEAREETKRNIEAHDETLNRLDDAVVIFDRAKRLSFHNTAFADLWGLEPAWLGERPTHGEILDRLRQRRRIPETADYAKWKAAELDRYEKLEAQPDDMWSTPDGRTLRVVRQSHPLGGLLLLFADITGELKMKAQYNALIQVQQATLDKLSDAVAVFGSDGRLRLHNESFERFWNITPLQIEAAGDFEGVVELCVHKLHDMVFWKDLKGRVADPDPTARMPITGEAQTSDDRTVEYRTRPLPDGATLIAFTDVTDARRLESALADREQALSEAERLKRDFVGNVSYELRTPLTTIIGYSELLEHSGDGLSERARGYAASVKSAATQLARSIDDVLDMAQIDADEMALDLTQVNVSDLLIEVASRWRAEAEPAKVSIVLERPDDVGVIRGDRRRLSQILDHLMENAIGQTPAGGTVTLAARKTLGEVQLQVSDTGRGIPFHVQAHIFDRFIGRERGGPGLGLALVKALTELHGGWVALESEPGAGATFTCHLPEVATTVSQPELGFAR